MSLNNYIESQEMLNIATDLIARYYLLLSHVHTEEIFFCLIKESCSTKSKGYSIEGLTSNCAKKILSDVGKEQIYFFSAYVNKWDEFSQAKKEWVIFESLYSIFAKGRLNKPDTIGHSVVFNTLMNYGVGVNWQNSPDLPNLLGKDVVNFILPPEEDEDESIHDDD